MYATIVFLHLCAVAGAFFASGVMLNAALRGADAGHVEKLMPLFTLVLLATGGWMTHARWTWSTPWVDTGIAGLLVMTIFGGAVLGSGKLAGRSLIAGQGLNVGLALGIMFLMITKPPLAGSIAAAVLGGAIGAAAFALLARPQAPSEVS